MAELRKGNIIWKNNLLPNSPENPVHIQDVNSDSAKERLDLLATEAKLEQVRALLSGVATENKLEQARTLLDAISTKDFATDAKLGDLQTLLGSLDGKDFATQTTLAQVKTELDLVKTELETIKANQLSGDQKVQLSGTKVVESAPVTRIKTVTSTVAEVFAGSSRKANRSKLVIRNLHQAVAIRIGGSGITDTIGQSLDPGASVEIDFSPSTTVSIYAVSTAGNVSVEVLEV
jgi:septal ring factor EnvC (AmiA/AmiB activator)